MDNLAATPPVQLVQNYYQCHKTFVAALQESVGASKGLSDTIMGPVLMVLGLLFVQYYNSFVFKKKLVSGHCRQIESALRSPSSSLLFLPLLSFKCPDLSP